MANTDSAMTMRSDVQERSAMMRSIAVASHPVRFS
jgi:hypothetical protein